MQMCFGLVVQLIISLMIYVILMFKSNGCVRHPRHLESCIILDILQIHVRHGVLLSPVFVYLCEHFTVLSLLASKGYSNNLMRKKNTF